MTNACIQIRPKKEFQLLLQDMNIGYMNVYVLEINCREKYKIFQIFEVLIFVPFKYTEGITGITHHTVKLGSPLQLYKV